jgi:hypothetical protein
MSPMEREAAMPRSLRTPRAAAIVTPWVELLFPLWILLLSLDILIASLGRNRGGGTR